MKSLRLGLTPWCLVFFLPAPSASAASPAASCQAQLQGTSNGRGADEALRACAPLFREPGCQVAWGELLDAPRASPGYGRGASVARLAAACQRAYCRFPGMGHQPLCTGHVPPALSAEFSDAWRAFQTEVLRRQHVSSATSDRLAQALRQWAGFLPRAGTRHVLQAVTRPDVPGVVALTLWSARGERLGAWVADLELDEATLRAVQTAVPAPPREAPGGACVRLEASPNLPRPSTESLLKALRAVCPADLVTVNEA